METSIHVWEGHMTWTVMKTCSIINPKCWMIHSCGPKKSIFKAVTEDVSAVSQIPKSTLFMNWIQSLFIPVSFRGVEIGVWSQTGGAGTPHSVQRRLQVAAPPQHGSRERNKEEKGNGDGGEMYKDRGWGAEVSRRRGCEWCERTKGWCVGGREKKNGEKVRKGRIMWGEAKKKEAERRSRTGGRDKERIKKGIRQCSNM